MIVLKESVRFPGTGCTNTSSQASWGCPASWVDRGAMTLKACGDQREFQNFARCGQLPLQTGSRVPSCVTACLPELLRLALGLKDQLQIV